MVTRADLILRWVSGPDVLDVGCAGHVPRPGSRQWVYGRLHERYPDAIGVDISRENVELLRAHGFAGVRLGDAQALDLDRRFDTIVAGEVIEHLGDPGRFLDGAREHLKPDGRLILTTPYAFGLLNWGYALLRYPTSCINPEHTLWFCPSTLKELVRRAGFRVEHWELILDLPDEPNPPVQLKRAVIRAYRALSWILPNRLRCNGMLFVLRAP